MRDPEHSDATAEAGPIVQYWHSRDVPPDVEKLTETFRAHNPEMRHLLLHAPEAEDFIAEHFTSREVAAFRACAVPAMQSDYFRYCAILALGGVYADAGLLCRRPLRPLIETVDDGLLIRLAPSRIIVNGCFLFASPGHPFLRLALDVVTSSIERRVANMVNMVTGPWVLTCLAELHRARSLDGAMRWARRPEINRLTEAIFEAAGDFERIDMAFRGIRVESAELARRWIDLPDVEPAYKDGETQWGLWPETRGSIFR